MKTGYQVIEEALDKVVKDKNHFPFPMSYEDGQIYRQGLIAAYVHALEMIPDLEE